MRKFLVSIAALIFSLTACGSSQESVADPPTPTPSPEAPVSKAEDPTPVAKQQTLREFADAWAAANLHMQQTGDASDYRRLAESACEPCSDYVDRVKDIYRSGGSIDIKRFEVSGISGVMKAGGVTTFTMSVVGSETIYRPTSTSPLQTLKGGPATYKISARREGGEWRVTTFSNITRAS